MVIPINGHDPPQARLIKHRSYTFNSSDEAKHYIKKIQSDKQPELGTPKQAIVRNTTQKKYSFKMGLPQRPLMFNGPEIGL